MSLIRSTAQRLLDAERATAREAAKLHPSQDAAQTFHMTKNQPPGRDAAPRDTTEPEPRLPGFIHWVDCESGRSANSCRSVPSASSADQGV
jgi:hypothetical protein